ncbi:MAG: chemotaxis protein CheX [Clostridiaceae bacterium]|nr:chemotaxis protein CheX [Clostridiaceae bacterium]
MEVREIFDTAFCDVTKKIVQLDLYKSGQEQQEKLGLQKCREVIRTHGYVNAVIVCQFSDEMFRYIPGAMNKGVPPTEEEVPLYINEYINIACGYAISRLNNMAGTPSRLSVPQFYQRGEPLEGDMNFDEKQCLSYRSRIGELQVYLFYSLKAE